MFLTALVSTAFAGQLAVGVGVAAGGGQNPDQSWSSVAPMANVSYMGHLLFLEGFGGLSASGLLARGASSTVMAAPLQAEAGIGIGGRAFGIGLMSSAGLAGGGAGLYSHLTLPGPGWAHRIGAEGRLMGYGSTHTGAFEVLLRVEPGRRRTPPPPDAPPPPPPEEVHHDSPYI